MIVQVVIDGQVYQWDVSFLCDDGGEPYTFEEN